MNSTWSGLQMSSIKISSTSHMERLDRYYHILLLMRLSIDIDILLQRSLLFVCCYYSFQVSSNKRLKDDLSLFGRSQIWQSVIFNDVVTHLITWYTVKLNLDSHWLTYKQLKTYANHIGFHRHTHIWGFVDGIVY